MFLKKICEKKVWQQYYTLVTFLMFATKKGKGKIKICEKGKNKYYCY